MSFQIHMAYWNTEGTLSYFALFIKIEATKSSQIQKTGKGIIKVVFMHYSRS